MQIDRRSLLIAGGVGAGLLVAWRLWPEGDAPLPVPEGSAEIGGLISLAPSGEITLHIPQVETGQGIWTALAQLAADEMGARLEDVAVQPLQAGAGFANPVIAEAFGRNVRLTGAATSVRGFAEPVRQAAAGIRGLLLAEAEALTDIDATSLTAINSEIIGGPRPLAFADLAEGAASRSVPGGMTLREWGSGGIAGTSAPRIDIAAKARGLWRFASDVRLPNMIHAAARLAPRGQRITRLDRAAADRPGLIDLIETPNYVAALGESWWQAEQALVAARVRFDTAPLDDASLSARLDAAMNEGRGETQFARGDASRALRGAEAPLSARYRFAPLVHHGLEPMSCAARQRSDGGLDIWATTQAPDALREAVAAATGVAIGAVSVIPMGVGDDSGRAIENDAAPIAAQLAIRTERPVMLTLSQSQTRLTSAMRSPGLVRASARISPERRIAAMQLRLVANGGMGASLDRLAGGDGRGIAPVVGRTGTPYAIPDLAIESVDAGLPLRTGHHRSSLDAMLNFASESMVDEVARAIGAEPVSFRIGMLGGDVRLAQLLGRVADAAQWDGGGPGSAMGVACAAIDGSRIALIAEAEMAAGSLRVARLVAAVDCGRVINPGLVEQQVAGGLLSALADMQDPAPVIERALPRLRGRPARPAMASIPEMEIIVMPSDAPMGGVTSLGAMGLAPALANALAADQGPRLRTVPFSLDR
ncbi:molybdopterin cofactor-binding domain-containing protein [Sphingomicrobium sediminis]|uniref:Molybdopterin-dependent oxidoreductase n=1 Tax=Sphingomicrobium sediminis TaxID=2950949 RepID=A0A9X2EGW5_9SPHN|nr:molybdopterin cofactor-binding domain-containing protein [Sphingomicrobium sediminis]MCM8557793.1 molybdopterin-dependent oxidoreductase [Sphingomicrobium sediminis]